MPRRKSRLGPKGAAKTAIVELPRSPVVHLAVLRNTQSPASIRATRERTAKRSCRTMLRGTPDTSGLDAPVQGEPASTSMPTRPNAYPTGSSTSPEAGKVSRFSTPLMDCDAVSEQGPPFSSRDESARKKDGQATGAMEAASAGALVEKAIAFSPFGTRRNPKRRRSRFHPATP